MAPIDIRIIDLAQYRTIPMLTVTGTISVTRSLVERSPPQLPDYVAASKKRLMSEIEHTQSAITTRLDDKFSLGAERSFDLLVDRVWGHLRSRLEFWGLYVHEGVDLFDQSERAELELDEGVALAQTAAQLLARLFGDGVEFLQMSYPEQAEHMAARLRYIEREGLGEVFEQLVGDHPALLMRICQRRYEAMVRERNSREGGVSVNLRLLREQLRRAAEDYASLLLSTIHEAEDDWITQVFAALKPMVVARNQARRGGGAGVVEDPAALEGDDPSDEVAPQG